MSIFLSLSRAHSSSAVHFCLCRYSSGHVTLSLSDFLLLQSCHFCPVFLLAGLFPASSPRTTLSVLRRFSPQRKVRHHRTAFVSATLQQSMVAVALSSSADQQQQQPHSISTNLTSLLQCRVPIVCAPMAGAAGGLLASAVHQGGGFGFIAGGHRPPAHLLQEIAICRNDLGLAEDDPLPYVLVLHHLRTHWSCSLRRWRM